MIIEHPDATCPRCSASLLYRFGAVPGGWQVVFLCARACGFVVRPETIHRDDIDHLDERHERALKLGERYS